MNLLIKLANKFLKLSQQSNEDIRKLIGVNQVLFGSQSWNYINQLFNLINQSLFDLSNKQLNFQTVIRNPSAAPKYAGSLKALVQLTLFLYKILTNKQEKTLTVNESKVIIDQLSKMIDNSEFPEPNAQHIKPKLEMILNGWKSILG